MNQTDAAITIRPGRESDDVIVLELLDGATRWLVAQGRTGQWGAQPASTDSRRIAQAASWARGGGLHLAYDDDVAVGALVVGDAPDYVPPNNDEPELYVNLLVTSREYTGRGIGHRLIRHARELARQRGVSLLRVDCYAGDDRALVRHYERLGFSATEGFTVELPDRVWPGQILVQRAD